MHISRILAASAITALAGNAVAQCTNYGLSQGTIVVDADDAIRTVGLPFSFPFGGNVYNALTIGTNGFIKFGTLTTTATELTDSETTLISGNDRIMVLWDDLNPGPAGNGDIYFAADATQATITFQGVTRFGLATAFANCECVIQPSGDIYLNYDASNTFGTVGNSSAMVGIGKGLNTITAGAHVLDLSTAAATPISVWSGYQIFTAFSGLTPFDLAGTTLHYAPVNLLTGDYLLTASPFTMGPCAPGIYPPVASATVTSNGVGCPAAVPNGSIYELFTVTTGTNAFDLTGVSMKFVRSGDNYLTVPGAGFDSNYTVAGTIEPTAADDVMINYPLAMGTFPFGTTNNSSVSLSTNGYVWMGASTTQSFNATAAAFNTGAARVAVYWKDLVPNITTAPIYIENTATYWQATWENVPHFSGGGQLTAQVRLDSNGDVSLSYLTATGPSTSSPPLVGITGGNSTNLGNDDLATGGVVNVINRQITGGYGPMVHSVNGSPKLGQNFVMTSTVPSQNVGVGIFILGTVNPNVPLDFIFGIGSAPGCTIYSDILDPPGLMFVFHTPGATTFSNTIPVPYDVSLGGIALTSQAAALTLLNPANVITSNGLAFTSGL